MNYHKLLAKQISKYLPENYLADKSMEKFLSVVSESYNAFDKDHELAERAFAIAEEEYLEINEKLKREINVRRQSVEKLKEAIGKITIDEKTNITDDLLIIARYLNSQVSKRRNAELVFSSLITNLPSGILLEDENRSIAFVNQCFCDIFNISVKPGDLQGIDCSTVVDCKFLFNNPDSFQKRINEILDKKELVLGEVVEMANGKTFERNYIPIFLDQKYKGNLWVYNDITEKKKIEEEYKRMSLVASANNNGVLFTSPDGRIIWANEGFSKITGFSSAEIIGKTPIELCRGPLTDKNTLDKLLNAFYSGNSFDVEIVYYRKDGTWFWGRSNTQPVKDNHGKVIQFFGIIDDVTEEIESKDRFRMALDKIGDNIWEHNFITGETKFSDSENHLLGYTNDEFNNNVDLWWRNIYPDDKGLLKDNDERYRSGKQDYHTLEYRVVSKSGDIKWVLDKGVVIEKTPDNKPAKIIGTHTDITSIKHAEIALRENEKRFRSLEENMPGILYKYEFNETGEEGFTYLSPDPENKIGITAEQLQNFYEILHPDDREREKRISRAAREKNTSYHFDGRFLVPGKPVIWLSLSSSYSRTDPNGTTVYAGIILNITKEKETELMIQLREKKYRNIIANMNLGLLEIDNDEIIRFANTSFCEMSGYKLNELNGMKASQLFLKDEQNEMLEIKSQQRKKERPNAFEMLVKNKRGESKWWLISNAPRYDEKGELIGSIGIHLDITDQKKLEHELVIAREQAESSAKAKQIFLANMSHEIRTPMNAIIGMTNQLKKTSLDKDQQFYLNIIHSAAENLLIIINDILDLSKLEAGKLNLEEIGFRPKSLIGQAMQVMMHKAEEKGLAFTNSFCDTKLFPVLIGDPYRLNQVLLNLFSNAIKFTERGGVDTKCEVLEENASYQTVQFVVKDSGIGMEESFLKNLFQKFRQEDESVTRRFGGTGLGMSICKELIEFMGGNIKVESKKGEGTTVTFVVRFQKGSEENLKNKETGVADANMLSGKRILVTDDNEMNRLVATTILKQYHAIPDEAQNGIEAIEKIKSGTYDIVLMDVQMPVMDGVEATKIIREQISKKLPVIALTALALKGDESKFRAAGMTDYLSKPFEETDLIRVISGCLGNTSFMLNNYSGTEIETTMEPLYDLSKLYEMSRGNQEFVNKMINMFIDQGPASVKEITEAYRQKDIIKMSKIAHRFKTSVLNMGISSVKTEIIELEQAAENNLPAEKLELLITNLEMAISKVVDDLTNKSIT
ncbi:MAG TPA: PAS domain S-box protein [Puia sp.]|nr:PAS domain S-box protein [Puia sp.]